MSRGDGTPLKDRFRRGGAQVVARGTAERGAGRHCWVVDSHEHLRRWSGVLLEWRRTDRGWDGLVANVIPEQRGDGVRRVERWVGATHLDGV